MTFSEWKISNDLKLFPYLLKKESHNLMPKKRLKDYSISNIVYDWARLERPAAEPKDLPSLMIENYSRSRQVSIFEFFVGSSPFNHNMKTICLRVIITLVFR